jgi:hypothetical protein
MILRFVLRVFCLLHRLSTACGTPPAFLFCLFWKKRHIFAQARLNHGPPIFGSCHTWDASAPHCEQLFGEMGFIKNFPGYPVSKILLNSAFKKVGLQV